MPAAIISLAYIDLVEGRLASATSGFQRGIAVMQRLWGGDRPEVASAQAGLAAAMLESRRVDEAAALLDAAQPFLASSFSDDRGFQAMEPVLRAVLAAARHDRDRTAEQVRAAWAAIEREPAAAQAGLWSVCARSIRPYRPDLARIAEKRSKTATREVAFRERVTP